MTGSERDNRKRGIRRLLWAYFWLLILEGALRKWLLPSLSNPLVIIRDPIALLAIWWGWKMLMASRWKPWVLVLYSIGILAFPLTFVAGHGDLITALFGLRILLLNLPLIFLFPLVFDQSAVRRFSIALLLTAIPMTVLIVLQYSLPQSHILNIGIGGEGSAGFSGALDKFRPPGTFAFTNGVSCFYPLCAAAFFALVYSPEKSRRLRMVTYTAGICLVIALPVSISRTLLFSYLLVIASTVATLLLSRSNIGTLIVSSTLIGFIIIGVTFTPIFRDAMVPFMTRWDGANKFEGGERGVGGVLDRRVFSPLVKPLNESEVPFIGRGLGSSTNVGASRVREGPAGFALGEEAWSATVGELGLILGPSLLSLRVILGYTILVVSLKCATAKNIVPLIYTGASLPAIVIANTATPVGLGFIVISTGLTLAAASNSRVLMSLRRFQILPIEMFNGTPHTTFSSTSK